MNKIVKLYNSVYAVCLINKKKDELLLGQAYEKTLKKYTESHPEYNFIYFSKIKFTWFDFHKECAHMKWSNLKFLMEELESSIIDYGYFSIDVDNNILLKQNGVFRVNCIDNLDSMYNYY